MGGCAIGGDVDWRRAEGGLVSKGGTASSYSPLPGLRPLLTHAPSAAPPPLRMPQTIKLKVPRVVAEKMKQMEAAKAAKAAKEAKEAGTEAGASSAPDADADAADSSSSGSGAGAGLKQRSLSITSEGVSIKVIDLSEIAGSESSSSDSESDSSSSSSSSSSVASSAAEQPQAQQQAAGPSEATAPAAAAAGAAPPVAGVVAAEATAATAEGLQEKPDEDLVEIEKKIPVRGKQHPLLAALYRAQMVSSRLRCGWEGVEVAKGAAPPWQVPAVHALYAGHFGMPAPASILSHRAFARPPALCRRRRWTMWAACCPTPLSWCWC